MDPDAALSELHVLAYQLRTILDGGEIGQLDAAASTFLDAFTGLDEWLTRGGFYPGAWSGQRTEAYEGYSNRETWAVYLWLSNDRRLSEQARMLLASCGDDRQAAETLKDWVELELWPALYRSHDGRNMQNNVGSVWRVEWTEVARDLRDD